MPELRNYKHERFSRFYIVTLGNASKSARLAGFAHKWAAKEGHRLLDKPQVKARIEELKAQEFETSEISIDLLLRAFWQEYVTADHTRDKIAALERIARMRGGFTDNVNQSAKPPMTEILKALKGVLPDETLTELADKFKVEVEQEAPSPTHDAPESAQ